MSIMIYNTILDDLRSKGDLLLEADRLRELVNLKIPDIEHIIYPAYYHAIECGLDRILIHLGDYSESASFEEKMSKVVLEDKDLYESVDFWKERGLYDSIVEFDYKAYPRMKMGGFEGLPELPCIQNILDRVLIVLIVIEG